MTAGPGLDRHGGGFGPSVRGSWFSRTSLVAWALLGIVGLSILVDGARGLLPAFPSGDLLYHWGLTHAILRGELPPGGPYQGLPAYYPPGFHLILAAISTVASTSVEAATWFLSIAWIPVLPLATFALARRLSGRGDVALVAAALTLFGGAFDFSADRLWVNSLFLVGHQEWPIFPRDLVFGLIPFGVLAWLKALESRRGLGWAIVAGGVFGACALIQVQLLLPIPVALLVVAVAAVWFDRPRLRHVAVTVLATAGVTLIAIAPWLGETVAAIRQNGGVALDSADTLQPASIGFWDYPREFGLLLPLAIVGVGVVLLVLRERDVASPWTRPRHPEEPLVLVPWFVVPWLMAVLYSPGWPLEDALRPQRLWLISSQPGAILASIGLIALVEEIAAHRWKRPRLIRPIVIAVVLVAAVPTVVMTTRLLFDTWVEPVYAHLQLDPDHVPDMAAMLGDAGPRSTVLTYEDWSSLAWYETGSWVVAVNPPGFAKLAFDPARFTGHSQADRRADVGRAFDGDPASLTAVADEYGATRMLLAKRGDRLGLIDQVAAVVAQQGGVSGATSILDGNGTDAVTLQPGARLTIDPATGGLPIDLEIRFAGRAGGGAVPDRHARLVAVGAEGERPLGDVVVPATTQDDWQVVPAEVSLRPGERLAVEAVDPVTVQSIRGFVDAAPPAGWAATASTDDAVVLERIR